MRVFTGSRDAFDRLGHERHVQTVSAELVLDHVADEVVVVRGLQSSRILEVDLELLHDVLVAALVQLGFDAADFLVTHLDVQAVTVQQLQRTLQRRTHRTERALPVLFFQLL